MQAAPRQVIEGTSEEITELLQQKAFTGRSLLVIVKPENAEEVWEERRQPAMNLEGRRSARELMGRPASERQAVLAASAKLMQKAYNEDLAKPVHERELTAFTALDGEPVHEEEEPNASQP